MDKIIDATYDKETGISSVTIGTPWGIFTESVKLHDDDKDVANQWDGCKFANYKCVIDKYLAKGHAFIERSNGINHAATVIARSRYEGGVSRIENQKEFNYMLGMMRDQAYIAERDGRKYIEIAKKMRKEYNNYVEKTLAARRNFGKKEE